MVRCVNGLECRAGSADCDIQTLNSQANAIMNDWSYLLQEHVCKGEAGSAGQGKADQLAVVRAQLREDVMTSICTGVTRAYAQVKDRSQHSCGSLQTDLPGSMQLIWQTIPFWTAIKVPFLKKLQLHLGAPAVFLAQAADVIGTDKLAVHCSRPAL